MLLKHEWIPTYQTSLVALTAVLEGLGFLNQFFRDKIKESINAFLTFIAVVLKQTKLKPLNSQQETTLIDQFLSCNFNLYISVIDAESVHRYAKYWVLL